MVTLEQYLAAAARRPFQWGVCDCCTFAFDWVVQRNGIDPMAAYRGRYGTALGAKRMARDLATAVHQAVTLPRTTTPVAGDVGLVETPAGPTMAIRTARGWAVKTPAGMACANLKPLAAWRVV